MQVGEEFVAIFASTTSLEKLICAQSLSRIQLFCNSGSSVTPWTVVHQVPLSVGFPRQEYWSGLPSPSPEALPIPGMEPASPASPALTGGFFTTEPPGKPKVEYSLVKISKKNINVLL